MRCVAISPDFTITAQPYPVLARDEVLRLDDAAAFVVATFVSRT